MDDPYYNRFMSSKAPSKSHCTHTNLTLKSGTHKFEDGTTFCRDTVFKPHAHVELDPGTYYFVDGYLQVQAGASVTCPICKDQSGKGVTLVFLGDDTRMIVRGGADVDLKAPATGDLAGFVIVDHKLESDSSIRETIIRGGGNVQIEGIIYTPQWQITISGNSAINQEAKYTAVIADTFYMEGNAEFHVKAEATAAGLPDLMPEVKTVPAVIN
jgi:hypothetical protein